MSTAAIASMNWLATWLAACGVAGTVADRMADCARALGADATREVQIDGEFYRWHLVARDERNRSVWSDMSGDGESPILATTAGDAPLHAEDADETCGNSAAGDQLKLGVPAKFQLPDLSQAALLQAHGLESVQATLAGASVWLKAPSPPIPEMAFFYSFLTHMRGARSIRERGTFFCSAKVEPLALY